MKKKMNVSMKAKVLLLTYMLITSLTAKAQDSNTDDFLQVYPPNAYALARYGDIPVDYSTGIPDISIPLMSISDRDITVDLSLSYHATGIKVDQEATWVGLGWVLNAGGVITRDIRGNADNGQERIVIEDFVPDPSNYEQSLKEYKNRTIPRIQQIAHGVEDFWDGESDMYYYNFNGRTGKFFLDTNNNICLFKHEDIKIDKNIFTITDESGKKYYFGKSGSITQEGKFYTTSWYLTKITSPAGGEINFEYENRASDYAVRRTHSTCFIDASNITGSLNVHEITYHAGDLTESVVHEPLLSKITTKSGHYIDLNVWEQKRKDTKGSLGNALKKISLYNARNEFLKGMELNYSYFEANTNRRYRNFENKELSVYNYLNYRLRLESVKEFSKLDEYAYAYHFEYYGDDNPGTDDVYTLPYRLSPCQDHWGYYNHSYNNVIFPGNSNSSYKHIETEPWIEQFTLGYPQIALPPKSHTIYGANRELNGEATKACTLNKIIYPTGGYTKFDFELKGDPSGTRGGLQIREIETCDNNGKVTKKKYSYSGITADMVYVDSNRNYYYTYLYNPILYRPSSLGYEMHTYYFNRIRSALSTIGVPPELVYGSNYNIADINTRDGVYLQVVKIDGNSPLRLGLEGETAYSTVIEEIEGLGKTEYHYKNYANQYESYHAGNDHEMIPGAFLTGYVGGLKDFWTDIYYSSINTTSLTFPYPTSIDYGWKNKLLTHKRVFDKDERIVSEDSISYTIKTLYAVPNFKAIQLTEYDYTYTRTYNVGGMAKMNKETNIVYVYDNGKKEEIRTVKEYNYDSELHKQVTEQKTYGSLQETVTSRYYYPPDYNGYFSTLEEKNFLAPVDTRVYVGNRLTEGLQISYNENCLPTTKYRAEPGTIDIPFNAQNPFTFTHYHTNTYYDENNLLKSAKGRDEVNAIYLWSYNKQYPVAEIRGATYNEVEAAVQSVFPVASINELANIPIPVESKLRDGSLQAALPHAQVSTYTYFPLVGMESATNPQNFTMYYDYDNFGRLHQSWFYDGDDIGILERYNYKYRSQ